MGKKHGFTIVELIVVIVVIGILAAIVTVSYSAAVEKSKVLKTNSDLNSMVEVINVATAKTGKTLWRIIKEYTDSQNYTNFNPVYSDQKCVHDWRSANSLTDDLRNIPATDPCTIDMKLTWDAIYKASGASISNSPPRDNWGSPYLVDANEDEATYYTEMHYATLSPCDTNTSHYEYLPGTNIDLIKSVGPNGVYADGASDDIYSDPPPDNVVCQGL